MIRGLYNGAAALDVISRQHEIISSNIAHVNTAGHRRVDLAVAQRNNGPQQGFLQELGPRVGETKIDFSEGIHRSTERPLDAAISGDAFFALEGEDGPLYTRDGRFYRSLETGNLVSDQGVPVLGVNGPINIDPEVGDAELSIQSDGTVTAGGQEFGKLRVVSFNDNTTLVPISRTTFAEGPETEIVDSDATVSQYQHEYSNVHPIAELVSLIVGSRQYEAVEKSTRAISDAVQEHIRTA